MAWAKCLYSKSRIDNAGRLLSLENPFVEAQTDMDEYFESVEVVNNWRAVHSYPLQVIKMILKRRARQVCASAIVAQRLKRLASIKSKLMLSTAQGNSPSLSQMQDIGGCRAILESADQVREVEHIFKESSKKNPHRGHQHSKTFDYILNPKPSGYRSVHLVYRFKSSSSEHSCYNGQRIEIQLRSRLQHYWATAVETYSTFSGEALKSNIGPERWKRFFALVSSALAIKEGRTTVPETPDRLDDLVPEIRHLYESLNVYNVLKGASEVAKQTADNPPDAIKSAVLYLLVLDPKTYSTTLYPYTKEMASSANDHYVKIEKDNPNLQAVLVSVDSVASLRAAYPNYYVDTDEFILEIGRILNNE